VTFPHAGPCGRSGPSTYSRSSSRL
jgi:hypothetical protein